LRPVAMLFDEPTSALDPESSAEVLTVMRELSTEGITMLVSTHEVGFALDASDRIVFIDRGKVVQAGPPREVVFGSASERARDFFAGFVRLGKTAGKGVRLIAVVGGGVIGLSVAYYLSRA